MARSLMLPTNVDFSLTPQTAAYFESCLKKLSIEVLNVTQHSVNLVLFEFLFEFRGYLKDWIESIKKAKFVTTPCIPTRGRQSTAFKQH